MANFDYTYSGSYYLRLTVNEVSGSMSVTNNTTDVSYSLTVYKTYGYGRYNGNYCPYNVKIDGETVASGSTKYNFENYESLTLASGTKTITHEPNGSKTISVSGYFDGDNGPSLGSGTASGTLTLSTVPRASSLTMTSSTSTIAQISASISRASDSFTHNLVLSYGGASQTVSFGSATSTNFNLSDDIRAKMKANSATSASITAVLNTYNGSTFVGSKSYTLTASVPLASISVSPASVAVNSATTSISISNYDSKASTITIQRLYGSTVVYNNESAGSNKDNSSFAAQITNAKSGTVTAKVTTYVGSATLGSQTATYTVTIPSSYGPTVSLVSGYPKRYSNDRQYGSIAYLAGYNGVQWQFTGTAQNRASVASITATITTGNATLSNSVSGSTITCSVTKLGAYASNYNVTIKCTVTDSRGYTAETTSTITATGYSLPTINESGTYLQRATSAGVADNEGRSANAYASATSHAVTTMKLLKIEYGTNLVSSVDNQSSRTITTSKTGYGSGFNEATEYTFTITATDNLGFTTTKNIVLPKASVWISLSESSTPGIGLGTTAREGVIDTPLPIVSTNNTPLHYRNKYGTFGIIWTKDGADNSGVGVAFGSGGSTIVGAGESASACLNDISSAGDENLWLAADGTVYLCPNSQTWSSRKTLSITYDGRILIPSTQFKITSESTVTQIIISDVTYSEVVAQDSSLSSSRDDDRWFSALIKALCAKYPNRSNIRFIGQTSPNSLRNYEITIYNTSDLKSGLPRYSYGLTHNYGGTLDRFGTGDYSYYRNTGVYYATSAGSANSATSATSSSYTDYVSLVATNEIRFKNRLTSSQDIWFNYKWYEGSYATCAGYRFGNGNAALTRVYASGFYLDANRQAPIEYKNLFTGTIKGGESHLIDMTSFSRIRVYAMTWGVQHCFEVDLSASGKAQSGHGLTDTTWPWQGGSVVPHRDGSGSSGGHLTYYTVSVKIGSDKKSMWVTAIGYQNIQDSYDNYETRLNNGEYYVYRVDGIV